MYIEIFDTKSGEAIKKEWISNEFFRVDDIVKEVRRKNPTIEKTCTSWDYKEVKEKNPGILLNYACSVNKQDKLFVGNKTWWINAYNAMQAKKILFGLLINQGWIKSTDRLTIKMNVYDRHDFKREVIIDSK